MKILYLDCFSGISGDMLLGAFIEAGLEKKCLTELPQKLNLPQVSLKIRKVNKSGLTGTKVDVFYPKEHVHRHLDDIEKIIDKGNISNSTKSMAKKIFKRLAEAEAEIHGVDINEIHFHEVGALDAIIDITGTALAIEVLGIEKVFTSTISVGGGMVNIAHGLYPVPAPATAVLLTGFKINHGPVNRELVTPTGAAIISVLTENSGEEIPEYIVKSIGYGAGSMDVDGMPNVVRMILGEEKKNFVRDEILKIEFNVDDMNPQLLPDIIERTISAGALDTFVTPIIMKKGRSGHIFTILLYEKDESTILDIVFNYTTTIGIRKTFQQRLKLKREVKKIESSFGEVIVKLITLPDGRVRVLPEFEECKRIAEKEGKSILDIQRILSAELLSTNERN